MATKVLESDGVTTLFYNQEITQAGGIFTSDVLDLGGGTIVATQFYDNEATLTGTVFVQGSNEEEDLQWETIYEHDLADGPSFIDDRTLGCKYLRVKIQPTGNTTDARCLVSVKGFR